MVQLSLLVAVYLGRAVAFPTRSPAAESGHSMGSRSLGVEWASTGWSQRARQVWPWAVPGLWQCQGLASSWGGPRGLSGRQVQALVEAGRSWSLWSFVETLDSPSMEAYVTETAEEVLLVWHLNSDDQAVVLKALRLAPEGRL